MRQLLMVTCVAASIWCVADSTDLVQTDQKTSTSPTESPVGSTVPSLDHSMTGFWWEGNASASDYPNSTAASSTTIAPTIPSSLSPKNQSNESSCTVSVMSTIFVILCLGLLVIWFLRRRRRKLQNNDKYDLLPLLASQSEQDDEHRREKRGEDRNRRKEYEDLAFKSVTKQHRC